MLRIILGELFIRFLDITSDIIKLIYRYCIKEICGNICSYTKNYYTYRSLKKVLNKLFTVCDYSNAATNTWMDIEYLDKLATKIKKQELIRRVNKHTISAPKRQPQ